MTPEEHAGKAKQIMHSMRKCRESDYELIIEAAMLASNHYVNAALHKLGIRSPERDVVHTDYLRVSEYRRLQILAGGLLHAIEGIEDLRAPFVRGCAEGGESAGNEARKLLQRAISEYESLKPNALPMQDYLPTA